MEGITANSEAWEDELNSILKPIGVVNDGLGAAYSTAEAITGSAIILTNKLNHASDLMKGVKIIKDIPAVDVIGNISDVVDTGYDAYQGNYFKAGVKATVLILKETIRFSSPIGFAIITAIDLGISLYDLYNDTQDDK